MLCFLDRRAQNRFALFVSTLRTLKKKKKKRWTQQFHAWLFAQQNVNTCFQKVMVRTSLVAQWLRLRSPDAGGPCAIPNQGTRSHMPQLRIHMLKQDSTCQNDPTEPIMERRQGRS